MNLLCNHSRNQTFVKCNQRLRFAYVSHILCELISIINCVGPYLRLASTKEKIIRVKVYGRVKKFNLRGF